MGRFGLWAAVLAHDPNHETARGESFFLSSWRWAITGPKVHQAGTEEHRDPLAGFQVARQRLWLRTNAESSANRAFGRRPGVILPDTRPNVAEVIVRPRVMAYFRAGPKVAISYPSPRGLGGKRRS